VFTSSAPVAIAARQDDGTWFEKGGPVGGCPNPAEHRVLAGP
jgi:hypothetical protein